MDQRISYVSNLKSHISKRHSLASPQTVTKEEEEKDCEEDIEYALSRGEVLESCFFQQCNKHTRIRLEKWIECLDKIVVNKIWKNNRNNYIKLLKLMCQCESLAFPFNALPSPTDLPTLKKHEINKIIDEVERQVKASKHPSRRMSCLLDSQGITTPKHKQSATAANILHPQDHDVKRFKTYYSNSYEDESLTLPMKLMQIQKDRQFETDFEERTIAKHPSIRKMENYKRYEHHKSNDSLSFVKRQDETIQSKVDYEIDEIIVKVRSNSRSTNNEAKKEASFAHTDYDSRPSLQSYPSKQPLQPILLKQLNKTIAKLPPTQLKIPKNTNKVQPTKRKPTDKQNDYDSRQERQYWESISWTGNNTGNGTPKYLDNFLQPNPQEEESESVEMISYRSHEAEICECAPLSDNWFTKLFSAGK